ncbi:disulfide bond formation protein B [Marivibrio halodurans]|uniref:Disulfide bond formation protein B n=2 Tax=Marivibrio halodurans TaxID=2039722 RepID=A0A8J7SB59_9PROT|nr:disulfide bond formation protein B [Marivibrio halodurans]
MTMLSPWIERPGRLGLILAVAAVAVLGVANFFEHAMGLKPCALCLYQRVPWWVALGLGCLAILGRRAPVLASVALGLGVLTLLAGAGIAGYHAGVEYGLWPGPAGCTGDNLPTSLGGLNEALKGPPPPRCDDVPWSLFGISMAGYNFLISLGGALLLFAAMRHAGRHRA